uniref:Microsomal glutathione S-transferase 2 isoform X2 n=1 Tax=Callorhinus ursinus TaxID=34884 RepID=A0A3Q7P8V8_CALUR|nr:microsomal glutathione S-transferase 2 isoform X2 [Callorhinus ursinus]
MVFQSRISEPYRWTSSVYQRALEVAEEERGSLMVREDTDIFCWTRWQRIMPPFTSLLGFATCLGLVYIYARHQYFWGYSEAAKKRITGFRLSLGSLALLTVLGALGIANSFLDEYLDLSVAKKLRHF